MPNLEFGSNEAVPMSYSPGFIVLSYLTSLAGCTTCLELLHRRTSRYGLYNWYLLLSAAVSMGGIGIWCMHYIGNRAIILAHGTIHQISYSSTFTAVSFLLPICVLIIAFYFIGTSERTSMWYIAFTGVLTGAAVCGMHYVGQLGIANYHCSYRTANVVGAAIIAVSASITALGVFFRMRASWTNSWWKRLISAAILAVAVSGMHWTATVGTYYRVKNLFLDNPGQLSASQTVIVCTTLSCAACVFLIALAILTKRQQKKTAHRVRQLVLASVFFDPNGGVMVSPEGHLPSQKITNQYIDRTFADEEFSKTHPAFIWAFRASRSWSIFKNLVTGMKYHLLSDISTKPFYPGHGGSTEAAARIDMDFESVFKELFCVAAQELAEKLHLPLEKLGVLYDDIVVTGTQSKRHHHEQEVMDPEALYALGKGQFLITVRQLTKDEAINFSSVGWRFAAGPQIAPILARSIQVSPDDMAASLEDIRGYSSGDRMMGPGIHLICFSLHPSVRKGFDVLVERDAPNILPHVTLPFESLAPWQGEIISQMDDWSLSFCLKWLKQQAESSSGKETKKFLEQMYRATVQLGELVESPAFGMAKFSSRQILIPCQSPGQPDSSSKCTALSFRIITGLQSRTTSPKLCLTPLRLFTAQQQVYPGVIDHTTFQQSVLEEFGYCAAHKALKSGSPGSSVITSTAPSSRGTKKGRKSEASKVSEIEDPRDNGKNPFAAIVVSNQVTVDVVERPLSYGDNNNAFEMHDLGVTTEARFAGTFDTFVDELCAICRDTVNTRRSSY